ncbi:ataxin-10-like [Ostrea edulis]|uniref:ataxin-10-like n=1 Tax=Ostrea edulis TaxID=37623 RepID=UPI0024AFF0CA|nr:ataxin-10-like [Ostrea edulis]
MEDQHGLTDDSAFSKLSELLSNSQVTRSEIHQEVQAAMELARDQNIREKITASDIKAVSDTLTYFVELMNADTASAYSGLTDCCRLLRNVCVQCVSVQDKILPCLEKIKSVINNCAELKRGNHDTESESSCVLFRCIVQFIGNCIVNHAKNQEYVWNNLQDELSDLLNYGDEKLCTYTCMVYHNCLRGMLDRKSEMGAQHCGQILCDVVKATIDKESEYGLFVVGDCLEIDGALAECDPELSDHEMLYVLEILIDQLKRLPKDSDSTHSISHPSVANLKFLVTKVALHAATILNVLEQQMEINPNIIVKQIEILGLATSHTHLYGELQNQADLLTTCLYLLHSIHRLGQHGDNVFSSVEKVTEIHQVDIHHPAFGLKKDIVRLLANLVHKHTENQDKVREMDGLPLILDQTNIDARNPYISQWAILAIHNLCENNLENQRVLSDLKVQGVSDKSAVVEELGIEVQLKNGKVSVKSRTQDK